MKKKRSAVDQAEGRRAVIESAPQGTAPRTVNNQPHRNRTENEVVAVVLSPPAPLWLTIFCIIVTQLGLGIDSLAKVLCGRKMCMKWKTTNLLRGFSSSRRSAATVQTSYGKHPVLRFIQTIFVHFSHKRKVWHFTSWVFCIFTMCQIAQCLPKLS